MKYTAIFNDLDPKMDWVFKMIFSNPKDNYKTLISFLNSILAKKYGKIKSIELLNTDMPKEKQDGSSFFLDFVIKTNTNLFIDLEMQNFKKDYFITRSQYYIFKMMNKFITFNQYQDLKFRDRNNDFAISISVCNFKLNEKEKRNVITKNYFLEFIYLEIPKIFNYTKGKKLEELSKEELWCRFLAYKAQDKTDGIISKICEMEDGIKMAQEAMVKVTQAERDAAIELSEWKYQFTLNAEKEISRRQGLKLGRKEGRKKGLIEGRAEGRAQGRAQGRAEGTTEGSHNKAIQSAKKMLEDGMEIQLIAKYTNLTLEEIKKL